MVLDVCCVHDFVASGGDISCGGAHAHGESLTSSVTWVASHAPSFYNRRSGRLQHRGQFGREGGMAVGALVVEVGVGERNSMKGRN